MWGNLHGWLISAVLALLILSPIAWLARQSQMSAPQGLALDPANLASLSLPIDPAWVCPIFTDDADAGATYGKAIDTWNADAESACRQFVQSPVASLPASLQLLVDARHCNRMTLYSARLADLINYDNEHPSLENLYAAGEWSYKAGLSLRLHGQTAQARPCLEAAFALGRQLYRERIVFDEFQKGMQLMADAAQAMLRIEPVGSALYDRLSDFQIRMNDFQDARVLPIWQMISTVDESVIDNSAGDVLAFAENSSERLWRVEATLKLGRLRFDAGTLGDQVGASRALRRLASDPDPAVAMAAAAATRLTIEQYRMIR
jgi:hypothetical protein